MGEQVVLNVVSSIDAVDYTLLTDFPFEQTDSNRFVVTPDSTSDSSTLTVIATKDGFQTVSASKTIQIKEVFSVDLRAMDSQDRYMALPLDVVLGGTPLSVILPYHTELRPTSNVDITFPKKVTLTEQGYALDRELW